MNKFSFFFFFNDTATTEIYTLSLHGRSSDLSYSGTLFKLNDQLYLVDVTAQDNMSLAGRIRGGGASQRHGLDRKSTRLNSSHSQTSYAVFCLKKKTLL